GPPPEPAPVMISAFPSPFRSAAATRTPPPNAGSYAKNERITAFETPSNTSTCGPPPAPAPVTMSALPSPFTSPAATNTPPENDGAYAKNDRITAPVAPSNTSTCGPPPGPAPVTMSPTPSPFTSPIATRTPPPNAELYARNDRNTAPDTPSNTPTCGPPPASAPDTIAGVVAAVAEGGAT